MGEKLKEKNLLNTEAVSSHEAGRNVETGQILEKDLSLDLEGRNSTQTKHPQIRRSAEPFTSLDLSHSKKDVAVQELSETSRIRYRITGTAWKLTGYVGFGILFLDQVTGHVFDFFLLGLPDALGLLGAFSWYHGDKQVQAARNGHTSRDLRLRGTFREIRGHAKHFLNQTLEYVGFKKKKDLRDWKNV